MFEEYFYLMPMSCVVIEFIIRDLFTYSYFDFLTSFIESLNRYSDTFASLKVFLIVTNLYNSG